MYAAIADLPELHDLALAQSGVFHRHQLRRAGISFSQLDAQLAGRRWTALGDAIILVQNAPPDRRQLMWAAVLAARGPAALGSHTALEVAGFSGFAAEADDIHLIVVRGSRPRHLPGVVVHESRRLAEDDLVIGRGPTRTSPARSAIDAGAWQPFPRFAAAMVSAVIQQRLTSADLVSRELEQAGRIRHRTYMRLAANAVGAGSHTLGEQDLLRACRRFGLTVPARQVRRRDPSARIRYLDAEWYLPDGETVVLEVDGAHHMAVEHWAADMRRERAIVVSGRRVLRATNFELRLEPAAIMADLRALGVPTTFELSERRRAIAS
jgi:hypothetical protein